VSYKIESTGPACNIEIEFDKAVELIPDIKKLCILIDRAANLLSELEIEASNGEFAVKAEDKDGVRKIDETIKPVNGSFAFRTIDMPELWMIEEWRLIGSLLDYFATIIDSHQATLMKIKWNV
jgi:hypothetical protein